MINNSELKAVELSPTKKDFYQIWNELMEVAGKLSERWDPAATNESDPGIVLLKVLTAVADKLNYSIDSNTLEAFMPSAAQEESMKKLCDMLGYNMKYYRSATTDVKISYQVNTKAAINGFVLIDKYTNIKDVDGNVNYITLEDVILTNGSTSKVVQCMEGELVECETDDNNIISMLQLDDNQRYYFPETQIAENGVFVTNITDGIASDLWDRVDNLNTQNIKSKVFKFGFDSKASLPYIQFPEDISNIIEDGLKVYYVRTNGIRGNISANTLCKMEAPANWSMNTSNEESGSEDYYTPENYTITNPSAAQNGCDKEEMSDAYNSYKKTIGTFDTLVTCRDYINRIYQMTSSDTSATNLVSNVIVSDIRDDINKAFTLCTFTDRGLEYKNMAVDVTTSNAEEIVKSIYDKNNQAAISLKKAEEDYKAGEILYSEGWKLSQVGKLFKVVDRVGGKTLFYARCIYNGNYLEAPKISTKALTHFDLVIYPFKNTYRLNTKLEYQKSFKYDNANLLEIEQGIEENRTLAHNIMEPNMDDIACIKNYLRLDAKITTTRKVSALEIADIEGKVYSKIYENFNMRKVDFGEEIPYNTILEVLESADSRIKSVTLEDPTIVTRFCTVSGQEYQTSVGITDIDQSTLHKTGDKYFNRLVLNNILAGRLPVFEYNERFKPDFSEVSYPSWAIKDAVSGTEQFKTYQMYYPETPIEVTDSSDGKYAEDAIYSLETSFTIDGKVDESSSGSGEEGGDTTTQMVKDIKLEDNEVIQFRLPNLKTVKTYPAYVNYYAQLKTKSSTNSVAIPATMQTLLRFLEKGATDSADKAVAWQGWANLKMPLASTKFNTLAELKAALQTYHAIFISKTGSDGTTIFEHISLEKLESGEEEFKATTDYSYPYFNTDVRGGNTTTWNSWIAGLTVDEIWVENDDEDKLKATEKIKGLYIHNGTDISKPLGMLVDINHNKYKLLSVPTAISIDPFEYYYVPRIWEKTVWPKNKDAIADSFAENYHTQNGLGQNGHHEGIVANEEYCLEEDEYLCFNYTQSSNSTGTEVKTKINKWYGPGTIIKPNFSLIDSKTLHEDSNKKYNKERGDDYNFAGCPIDPEGLFTLGSDEQIEIREFIGVTLDEISTNIYWERKDEIRDSHNRVIFEFNEDPIDVTDSLGNTKTVNTSYTLKEGEYFYYTDHNKTDIAYYGAGTKITRTQYTPDIYKYYTDSSTTSEEISTNGLSSAITWRAFDFSKSGGRDKKLTLTEYQYINLTKDNTLHWVSKSDNANTEEFTPNGIEIDIDNDFKDIVSASYTIGDTTQKLPTVNLKSKGIKWQVRSKLELNVGPDQPQTLHTSTFTKDKIILKDVRGKTLETLEALNGVPLSFKTNLPVIGFGNIDVTTKQYNSDTGGLEDSVPLLQIKVFYQSPVVDVFGKSLNLNNFGNDDCTKIDFNDVTNKDISATALNVTLPQNHEGLIMFYYIKSLKEDYKTDLLKISKIENTAACLRATKTDNSVTDFPLSIFNKSEFAGTIGADGKPVANENIATWWQGDEYEASVYPQLNPNRTGSIVTSKAWAYPSTFSKTTQEVYNSLKETLYRQQLVAQIDSKGVVTIPGGVAIIDYEERNEQISIDSENTNYFKKPRLYYKSREGLTEANLSTNLSVNDLYTYAEVQIADSDTPYVYHYGIAPDGLNYNIYCYPKVCAAAPWNETFNEEAYYGRLASLATNSTNLYQLREGLNIIKVTNSCTIQMFAGNNSSDIVIFGPLKIIPAITYDEQQETLIATSPIHPKLSYKKVTESHPYLQLLEDIRNLDPNYNFYYNAPISNSVRIDLNDLDDADTMDHPSNWYDQNNINNKFVISQIDADYLIDHVRVSRASRR